MLIVSKRERERRRILSYLLALDFPSRCVSAGFKERSYDHCHQQSSSMWICQRSRYDLTLIKLTLNSLRLNSVRPALRNRGSVVGGGDSNKDLSICHAKPNIWLCLFVQNDLFKNNLEVDFFSL
ncbi:MAG: hypothetical protein DWH73_00190 [Planctomycetota bacterium]|nr:MAG: hypothetical protein DWH73_00190 [Planctomycetota bacterium]